MKKTITLISLILLGIVVGFIVGQNTTPIERFKIVKERVVDTVYKSNIVRIPIETEVKVIDTVYLEEEVVVAAIDSQLTDNAIIVDEIEDDDSLEIKKDERLKSETLEIRILKNAVEDTLLHKLLEVENIKPKKMLIEYWESPVNYKGYKLSKSKLIVYGINPIMESVLYKIENNYILKANNLYYELNETANFKPYYPTSKPDLIND